MSACARPILRYHGGKWRLAPWIISHFPAHRTYVEPYGGAASVLLRKERAYSEVYNDLDGEIVNLFRVAREHGEKLRHALTFTPYARDEYRLSFDVATCPIEQARRTVIRSYMGFGSNSLCRLVKSGFRSNSNRSYTTPSRDWMNFPPKLDAIIERLRGVVIENKPALEVMLQHDSERTLHYCDPTYVHETRTAWAGHGARSGYAHEMTNEDHRAMAAVLEGLRGAVVLSGYECPLYEELFSKWNMVKKVALADGARPRVECLWIKP
jgi:DNA adenine methylase